jgi:tRNA dimethylallyltransferase
MSASVPPLLVIAGPTASGKSALAIRAALAMGAEIISADSQQVYRHFDIGTAKPSAQELAQVPHHLVSVVEPTELFSAVRFQTLADAAISDAHGRGKRVVVVGGTGLYLRVLLHGVVAAPPGQPQLRSQLEADAVAQGRAAMHARLAAVDPQTAAWVKPTDLVRIIRALEIHALTGQPASQWRAEHAFAQARYKFQMVVLAPPRDALYAAINARTKEMFARGLVAEARALVARGFRDAAPMGSVGYAQALAVIEGGMSEDEAILQTAQATRHYAKRQLTWFRKEQGARFVWPVEDALREL